MKKWANRNTNQKSPKRAQTKESGPRRPRGSTVNLANGSDDPNGSVRGSWAEARILRDQRLQNATLR